VSTEQGILSVWLPVDIGQKMWFSLDISCKIPVDVTLHFDLMNLIFYSFWINVIVSSEPYLLWEPEGKLWLFAKFDRIPAL
jgi:hypothetical protein